MFVGVGAGVASTCLLKCSQCFGFITQNSQFKICRNWTEACKEEEEDAQENEKKI